MFSPPLRDMVKNLPKKAETSWKDGVVKNMFNHPSTTKKAWMPGGQFGPEPPDDKTAHCLQHKQL